MVIKVFKKTVVNPGLKISVLPHERETVLIKFQLRFENPGVLDKHKILRAPF